MADEVVAAYATKLFIRSEAEIRRPVVLLTGERTNVFGVLEKHFKETALPPSERFWRTVRTQWTPQLETWRPRVNGTQLKVLSGARLPESEEEWGALRAALGGLRQHLRADSSVERLTAELRDFVAMVVAWWENRKKGEGSGHGMSLIPPALLMGLVPPPAKKPCLEFMPLVPVSQPPQQQQLQQQQQQQNGYQPVYAAPEIVQHTLLGGGGNSGRLSGDRVDNLPPPPQQQQQHGGSGFLQQLGGADDSQQLFGHMFPLDANCSGGGGGGVATGAARESQSPRDLHHHQQQQQHYNHQQQQQQQYQQHQEAAAMMALDPINVGGGGGGNDGSGGYYFPQSPGARREGSADIKEIPRVVSTAAAGSKRFVTLNVGGHRFLTAATTLAAAPGSYFAKLAQQATAGRSAGASEFFVDRSGKIFEYVLDFLRSQRFNDSASILPRDERTLQLLAREADFYQLPGLASRVEAALAAAATVDAARAEDTPSDMPGAMAAAEGSAHGGQLTAGRLLGANGAGGAGQLSTLDALYLETGFCQAAALAAAQAKLLQELNSTVQAKQAAGFAIADYQCGTEREGGQRNLYYHVLLRRAGAGAP